MTVKSWAKKACSLGQTSIPDRHAPRSKHHLLEAAEQGSIRGPRQAGSKISRSVNARAAPILWKAELNHMQIIILLWEA